MTGAAARALGAAAAVALLFAVPTFTRNEYILALGVSFAAFSVLASGLNLVYGYTGLLSFAQVAFFGVGGYTAALLVTELNWSLWSGALAAGILAALLGLGIGYSSLRLSRHAFAIVTLSFALLCMIVSRDWVSLTRGAMGIPGLPVPSLALPAGASWRLNKPADFFYLLMAFSLVSHLLIYALVTSRIGRALRAIKLNEPLAQSQGINPLGYKLLTVTLSALLSGIVGAFFVFYLTIVDPSVFDFYYTET
ncbi:MAG TPA: branched-chain amino acid ABC transporter permease, partial [Ramlibacter sp.]|nr:branched-chain amino acid ABC transporter permease [Ramlibacter sp.]